MFGVNDVFVPQKLASIIISTGVDDQEPKEVVKLLVNLSEVSKSWSELSRSLLVNILNKKKWSLKDVDVLPVKQKKTFFLIEPISSTIVKTDKIISFLKLFGCRIENLSLEGLELSKSMSSNLHIYCPQSWSFTKEIEKIENYVTKLEPVVRDKIVDRFRTASLTILDNPPRILNWFSDMDLDDETISNLKEFDLSIRNYFLENKITEVGALKEIYLRNFCGLKLNYKSKGWRSALLSFTDYLKKYPDKELSKKVLEEMNKGTRGEFYDFSIPFSRWFKNIDMPVKVQLRLLDLEKEISREMSNTEDLMGLFDEMQKELMSIDV